MTATRNSADWTKTFGNLNNFNTAVDLGEALGRARRTAETSSKVLSEVAQISLESSKAIGQCVAENLKSNAKKIKELPRRSANENSASRQAEFARDWFESNVASLREISEIGTKAVQEAFDILSRHAAKQLEEFSDAAGSAATQAARKKAA